MKKLVKEYIFAPTEQRIYIKDEFLHNHSIKTESFLLVTNLTTGDMIYIFNEAALGGVFQYNYLTLDYDISTMSASDKLQIFVDVSPAMHIKGEKGALLGGTPNEAIYVVSETTDSTLVRMLKELKKINLHLQTITDENITNRDLDGDL